MAGYNFYNNTQGRDVSTSNTRTYGVCGQVKLKASSGPSPVYRRWPLVQKCSRDLFRRRERFHQEMGRETRILSSLRVQHPKMDYFLVLSFT